MRIPKAVLTAASPTQRELPLQTLIAPDGARRTVLSALLHEARGAGVGDIAVLLHSGDRDLYARAAGADDVHWIEQPDPDGYADALLRARAFCGDDAFLHLVADHVWLSRRDETCAQQLVAVARQERCTVCAVQATRESQLPSFGAVGGVPVANRPGLFTIDDVIEKPTPTQAEQRLHVSGLRAGQYLCFFGMHVLTPGIWPHVEATCAAGGRALSPALAALARRERCLAFVPDGARYDVGRRHGLLVAQLALALSGPDRAAVLAELVELLATRSAGSA